MKIYIGITDRGWFDQLRDDHANEVNFWRPGGKSPFKALQPNELFLFRQHSKDGGKICGGGTFVSSSIMPCDAAWRKFERGNGVPDCISLRERILRYRQQAGGDMLRLDIGCIVLTKTFFFNEDEFLDPPSDWARPVGPGKSYDTAEELGARLFEQVQNVLAKRIA